MEIKDLKGRRVKVGDTVAYSATGAVAMGVVAELPKYSQDKIVISRRLDINQNAKGAAKGTARLQSTSPVLIINEGCHLCGSTALVYHEGWCELFDD